MAADATLRELCGQFEKYLQAGKDAHLFLECHEGKLFIDFHLQIDISPSSSRKKASPSRLRRRARRHEKQKNYAAENACINALTTKETCAPVASVTSVQAGPAVEASNLGTAQGTTAAGKPTQKVAEISAEKVVTSSPLLPQALQFLSMMDSKTKL